MLVMMAQNIVFPSPRRSFTHFHVRLVHQLTPPFLPEQQSKYN